MGEIKVALCGGVRVGKDTAAEYFEDYLNMVTFSFGYDLKKEFHEAFPHIPKDPKPVRGYQLFGDLMRYVYGENYWVDKCFNRVEKQRSMAKNYSQPWVAEENGISPYEGPSFNPLITDVRLPAEAKRCKEEGYFVVRIVSPLEQRKERMRKEGDLFNDDVFTSEAEKYIDSLDVDYEIVNDGTLEDFKAKLSVAVEKIVGYSWVL